MAKRGSGEGTVVHNAARKRWEGRLTIGFDEAGRQLRRKVTGRTQAEVVRRLRGLRDATDAGQALARRDLTVGRFLDEWLADVLPGTVAPLTERQYRDVVRLYVKPHLGRKHLRTLNARDVAAMLRALEAAGMAGNTRRLARSILRRALRYAEREGVLTRNVAALADGVKLATAEGRALTLAQARALLASIEGDPAEAAFVVALALGLRLGELLGLAWPDLALDADPPVLHVRRALKRVGGAGLHAAETKTRTSRRTLHLPAPVVVALRAHALRQKQDRLAAGEEWVGRPLGLDLVFRTSFGSAVDPSNFRHACYSATITAGLGRWSPHELRHSAASLLLAMNVPLKVVSETLGHSSIRVTADVYGHLLDEARAGAADAMERALWRDGIAP